MRWRSRLMSSVLTDRVLLSQPVLVGIGDWFRKLLGKRINDGEPAEGGLDSGEAGDASRAPSGSSGPKRPGTRWLEPGDPGNPFDVRLLDLMENLGLISTTTDPKMAERSLSWRPGGQRDIDVHVEGTTHACNLPYPAPAELPEGMLYRPAAMEDKWVLAYRDGRVAAARSWTGETKAVARARQEGKSLVLSELTVASDAALDAFGDPVAAFDWLIRVHALQAKIPFPASRDGVERLSEDPMLGFSIYGRQLFCAAFDYKLGDATGRLHCDGDLMAAVASGNADRLAEAIEAGLPLNAPSTFSDGATALHLAVFVHPELVATLLAAGASPNVGSLLGATPLMAAASANRPEVITQLLDAGAELHAADARGFAVAHVAAQFDRVEALASLVEHGASLSQETERGLAPSHVAAGLGKKSTVAWLLAHGVDPTLPSPLGDPLRIAEENGHVEVAELLRGAQSRTR